MKPIDKAVKAAQEKVHKLVDELAHEALAELGHKIGGWKNHVNSEFKKL
jgi:hypothetical protein